MNNPNSIAPVPQNQQQFKSKPRKREAVQKYEPETFREELFALLPANETEIDAYCVAIEQNEAKLDLKRYIEPFFELFIVGGLIGPGGSISIKERNPFAIFEGEDTIESVKKRVSILTKLARRLKYFPLKLEETLQHLLTYINKFGANLNKLATACGLLAAAGVVSIGVLESTLKDHLIADGSALKFLTGTLIAYLKEQPIDHLSLSMRRAKMDWKLSHFFPTRANTTTLQLTTYFSEHGLKNVADYFTRQQILAVKSETGETLKNMFSEGKSAAEIEKYLKAKVVENSWPDNEIPALLWDSLILSVDWTSRGDQLEGSMIKLMTQWAPLFSQFCTSAKSELALLLHVQTFCYEDSRFLKHFRVIVQHLYKHDALSESAILYWFSKGAGQQGKIMLLQQMEPFIKWLKEQEEESD